MTRLESAIRIILVEALEHNNFNVSKTCTYLGVPRPTFYRYVKKYALPKKQRKARTKKHTAATEQAQTGLDLPKSELLP